MHKKSLEAAEALKNDESGNSDREDSQSKASDVSSVGNNNNNKSSPSSSSSSSTGQLGSHGFVGSALHDSRHSVTPTSSSGPSVGLPPMIVTSPGASSTPSTTVASITPPPPPPPLSSHHLSAMEAKSQTDAMSIMSSPSHPNYHPEGDPEAFRWVDFNRDPISFIRCDFVNLFFLIDFTFFLS